MVLLASIMILFFKSCRARHNVTITDHNLKSYHSRRPKSPHVKSGCNHVDEMESRNKNFVTRRKLISKTGVIFGILRF